MKKGEKKAPDIYNDPLLVMTPEEKAMIRQSLTSPVYVKLMRFVERYKPSCNCRGAGSGERDAFSNDRANARLGEIRGWELHLASIFRALSDTPAPSTETEPTYPSSGVLSVEPTTVSPKK